MEWIDLLKVVSQTDFLEDLETLDQNKIENGFSKLFTGIGPKILSSILNSSIVFKDFTDITDILWHFTDILWHGNILQNSKQEIDVNSLKSNNTQDFKEILLSAAKFCSSSISYPKHIFSKYIYIYIYIYGIKIVIKFYFKSKVVFRCHIQLNIRLCS